MRDPEALPAPVAAAVVVAAAGTGSYRAAERSRGRSHIGPEVDIPVAVEDTPAVGTSVVGTPVVGTPVVDTPVVDTHVVMEG